MILPRPYILCIPKGATGSSYYAFLKVPLVECSITTHYPAQLPGFVIEIYSQMMLPLYWCEFQTRILQGGHEY